MRSISVMKLDVGDVVVDSKGVYVYTVIEGHKDRGDGSSRIKVVYPDGGPGEIAWILPAKNIKENVEGKNMEEVERYFARDTPAQRAARAARAAEARSTPRAKKAIKDKERQASK